MKWQKHVQCAWMDCAALPVMLRLCTTLNDDGASISVATMRKLGYITLAAMEGLKSADTFEDASDAVCELVLCTSSRGEPEPHMLPLVQLLVPVVCLLVYSS